VSVQWIVYTTSRSRRHGQAAAAVGASAAEFITRDVN